MNLQMYTSAYSVYAERICVSYTSTKSKNEPANVCRCCAQCMLQKKKPATQALSLWMNLQMYAAAALSLC